MVSPRSLRRTRHIKDRTRLFSAPPGVHLGHRCRCSTLRSRFMTDLASVLEQLGLAQYHVRFVAEGFDTWETLVDITEEDL